ncbi:MAG: flagellar protein FliT [Methylovulum sp.]|jgi:hypothetical protein
MALAPHNNQDLPAEDAFNVLQEVLALTTLIHTKAYQDEWDEVIELETKRRTLITACFAQTLPDHLAEKFDNAITAIVNMDQEVMALGTQKMTEYSVELQKLDYGRKAVKAYNE